MGLDQVNVKASFDVVEYRTDADILGAVHDSKTIYWYPLRTVYSKIWLSCDIIEIILLRILRRL